MAAKAALVPEPRRVAKSEPVPEKTYEIVVKGKKANDALRMVAAGWGHRNIGDLLAWAAVDTIDKLIATVEDQYGNPEERFYATGLISGREHRERFAGESVVGEER